MRTMYSKFPEYYTSADNLEFMEKGKIGETAEFYLRSFYILERNKIFTNLFPYGEPQLGKRGLFRVIGANKDPLSSDYFNELAILWVLNFSNNKFSLLDISIKSGIEFNQIFSPAKTLTEHGLIKEIIS